MKYIITITTFFIYNMLWLGLVSSQGVNAQCEFTIGTVNENSAFTQMFILADDNGVIIDIINGSNGTFTTPSVGSYNVHALNYDPNDPPDPFPVIGGTIVDVGTVSGCFNGNLASDIKPLECLCDAATTSVSYNPQPGFSVTYVLADATGLILAVNTTGVFVAADGLADDTFIHALHYDTANPPDPLPTVGINVADVGINDIGCFNSEFVTNPLCIALSPAPVDAPVDIIRVCEGNALFASLDGATPMDGTGLTFVWYLNGNVVATIDGSPYYSPQTPGDYTVQIFSNIDCSTYTGTGAFDVTEIIDCTDCN